MLIPPDKKKYFETLLGYELHRSFFLKDEKEILKEAYDKAHQIRQYEVGLYWQRNTYYWTMLSVLLVTFGFCFSHYIDEKKNIWLYSSFALSTLGFMLSFLFLALCRTGSFWQKNWENHIEILEPFFSGNLYKTVFTQSGARFSIGLLNELTICIIIICWLFFCVFVFDKIWTEDLYHGSLYLGLMCIFFILYRRCLSKNENSLVTFTTRKIHFK